MVEFAFGLVVGALISFLIARRRFVPWWLRGESEFIAFLEALLTVDQEMFESGMEKNHSGFWYVIARTIENPMRIKRLAMYLYDEGDGKAEKEVNNALKVLVKSFLKVDMKQRRN